MAEVGVLNLTIKDNSEQAGKGLSALERALNAVKSAQQGFTLTKVSSEVQKLVNSINKTQATTLKNISGLLNAVTSFSKVKSFNIDVTQFEKLREAVGDGFKIGNAGSQLKQLQEAMRGDWGDGSGMTALKDLRDLTQSVGAGQSGMQAMANTLRDIADSYKRIGNASAAAGDWRSAMGMAAGSSAGKSTAEGVTSGIEDGKQEATKAAAEIAYAIINALKDVLEIHSPSRVMMNLGEYAAQGFNEGFITVKAQAEETAEQTAASIISAFKTLQNIQSENPVAVIASSMRGANEASEAYKSILSGTLPKVQALSSEEMMVAGHAKLAKAEIDSLIKTLEKPIGYKGLSEFIDVKTGVKGGMQGGGMINENTTMLGSLAAQTDALERVETAANAAAEAQRKVNDVGEMYAGVVSIFDEAEGHWKQIYIDTDKAAESTERAAEATREGISLLTIPASGMNGVFANASEEMNWLTEQIEKAKASMDQFAEIAAKAEKQLKYGGPRSKDDLSFDLKHATEGFYEAMNAEEQYKAALQTLMTYVAAYADVARNAISVTSGASIAGEVARAGETGFLTAAADADTFADSTEAAEFKVSTMVQILWDLGNAVSETREDFRHLDDRMKAMFPTLTGMIKRFTSMAKMRALRYVIRAIAKGFSEGVENVYWYSKAVGTDLAPSMDAAATAMLQFKNSIGAAVAPLIQAFVPVLQTVISWLITGINYLNQFFALLNGQSTWTKAVEYQTAAYEDNSKKAKSAAQATKDLLADWDELNVIQSQNNGGSTGTTGKDVKDYSKMFEQVSTYDSWIKNLVSGIEEEFGSIWNLAKKVGLAILGWKVSSAFSGILGAIGGLVGTAFTLDLIFKITSLLDNKWLQTGKVGWLISSALTPLIGGVLVKKILGNVLGGKFARLAIPLSLMFSATADVVANVGNTDVSAISMESLGLNAKAALEVGGAAAYLAKVFGHTLGKSLAGGTAIAIATFGVAVGIKTVARAVKGADTAETIKGLALSSLSVGIGAGLFAKLAGATVLGALGFGALAAGATLLTLTAAIGIAALLTSANEKVKWGDFEATKEQIRAFVEDPENGVFTVSPNTILSIVDPLIEVKSSSEEGLKTSIDEVRLDVKKLTLGLNDNDILDSLHEKIFGTGEEGSEGLLDKFRRTAAAHEEIIETGITIVPSTTNDDGSAKEIIDRSGDAWEMLTGHMEALGEDLAKHFETAYDKSITEAAKKEELKTIAELSQMMANVSAAITNGEQYEISMQLLEANLTQGSWDQMFEYIEEYKRQIKEAYASTYDQTTVSIAGQVSGLKTALDNELKLADEALTEADRERHRANAQAYKDEFEYWNNILEERRAGRQDAIDRAVKNAENEETTERINKILASKIDRNLINEGVILGGLVPDLSQEYGAGYQQKIVDSLFNADGTVSSDASDQIKTWLNRLIDSAFGDDASTIEKAIELGMLGYGDVIDQTAINQLASAIGITDDSPVKEAWDGLIGSLIQSPIVIPPAEDTTFIKRLEELKQTVADAVYKIKLDLASLDGVNVSLAVNMATGAMTGAFGSMIQKRASGGFVRSGDLVMANENGNFEMMGRMGNQPVVANNQQIISGISQGVATANGGVENRLSAIENLLIHLMNKELVAKVVPSSTMGRSNQMSADAYDRVRG